MFVSWVIPNLSNWPSISTIREAVNVKGIGEPLMAGHQPWESLASEGDKFIVEPQR